MSLQASLRWRLSYVVSNFKLVMLRFNSYLNVLIHAETRYKWEITFRLI
jgi:hypothetical protein